MSALAGARLLAEPDTTSGRPDARVAVFLVGGYDGSGNFGDMLQLQAALELLGGLGGVVLPVVVIEREHRSGHAELAAGSPVLASAPVCCFDASGTRADGLVPLALPRGLTVAALYFYGGGYLNAAWGARKLAMARAVGRAARAAGVPTVSPLATGLQVDAGWAAELDPADRALLEQMHPFGVRDTGSLSALGVEAEPGVLTGDDAVGALAPYVDGDAGAVPARSPIGPLRLNLHVQETPWVTSDPSGHERFLTALLAALGRQAGRPLVIQPVIAYEDRRTTERGLLARLAQVASPESFAQEPIVLRPGDLGTSLGMLAGAELTVSCSYHVALTSLLLGVPAALLAGNPYYAQKASGLTTQLNLPEAFVVDPHGVAEDAAVRLGDALLAAGGREAIDRSLRLGALRSVRLRRETEVLVLTRLAAAVAGAPVAAPDPGGPEPAGRVEELMERLAVLRIDHQELLVACDRAREHVAGQRARLDELESLQAHCRELEEELEQQRRLAGELWAANAVNLGSRSWRVTAPMRRAGRALRNAGLLRT